MEYLIKTSAIILIFYLCYKLFLQRETFFETNRWFLLAGIIVAFCLPFVVIPIYITETIQTSATNNFILQEVPLTASSTIIEGAYSLDWSALIPYLYGAGVIVLCTRFIIQLSSLFFLIYKSNRFRVGSNIHAEVTDAISPFSFFNYVVYNPTHFNQSELQQIIAHEKVHVNQWHSLDILLTQIAAIVCWFNPIIWLYLKDLKQNLEFVADKNAIEQSKNNKAYQYVMLKTSVPNYQMALTNNFYNSLIKKRIVMLNKNRSKNRNQLKLAVVLPLLAVFLMSFNTKEIITYVDDNTSEILSNENTYVTDYSTNEMLPIENTFVSGDNTNEVLETSTSTFAAVVSDMEAIITKDMTDAQLDKLVEKFKKNNVNLKFKKVKRNSSGEITGLEISAKTDKSNANFHQSDDDGIQPITISVHNESISIGNGKDTGHRDLVFTTKDGNHKVHKIKEGGSVYFYSDDEHEHDDEHEVIEDDDKIIIKSGAKVHEIKKVHKDKNVWVTSGDDGEVIEIKGDADKVIIKKDKDGNYAKLNWSDKNSGNVWVDQDGENTFELKTIGKGNKFFISGTGESEPLYIVNDKEVSKKEMNKKVDPDNIESVTVLKGKAAEEKYGKKGENGVIIIKTKDK